MPTYKSFIPFTKPYTPELMPLVQKLFESIINPASSNLYSNVLEFGSGHSTLWLSGLCNLVSIEHDPKWYGEVEKELNTIGVQVKLYLKNEKNFTEPLKEFPDEYFDVIFIDSLDRLRSRAIVESINKVKSKGYMIIDDSQWTMLQNAINVLRNKKWNETIVSGTKIRKSGRPTKTQTSFWRKP